MNTMPEDPELAFNAGVAAGMRDASEETARKLAACSPLERWLWAATATGSGVYVPVAALAKKSARSEDEVRAALVVLVTRKLGAFHEDGFSHAGHWGHEVSRVLGGKPGSACYPRWDWEVDGRTGKVVR